jgi:hypothetical protein
MKPRLRLVRGMWQCGLIGEALYWSVASTPAEAFELWERCRR